MKVKNLSFLERHVEKIVLGVVALLTLYVLWSFVLSDPYTVEVNGQRLGPAELEQRIRQTATSVSTALTGPDVPADLLAYQKPEYIPAFRDRLLRTREVQDKDPFEHILGQHGLDPEAVQVVAPDQVPFVERTPPPAANLQVAQGYGVLEEPANIDQALAWEKVVGPRQPRDVRWVSIKATFPIEAWRQALRSADPGMAPIPDDRLRQLAVVDVRLEREMRDPQTGRWGQREVIAVLPHHVPNFRQVPVRNWSPREASDTVRLIQLQQDRLARPLFAPLAEGLWMPPGADPRQLSQDRQARAERLAQEIVEVQREIQRRRLVAIGQAAPAAPQGPVAPMGPGALEPAMPEGPGAMTVGPDGRPLVPAGPGGAASGSPPASGQDLAGLQRTLTELRRDFFRTLGVEGAPSTTAPSAEAAPSRPASPSQPAEPATAAIDVWAHDLTVEPGMTYRYRVVLSVVNPLFQQEKMIEHQHQKYFNQLTLETPPSEWSQPVTVEPEFEYYIVETNPTQRTAKVEVYGIFNGQRVRKEFDVRPGDPIGEVVTIAASGFERQVDMRLSTVLVDITFDTAATGDRKNTRVMLLDRISGALTARNVEADRNSIERLRRRQDAAAVESVASRQ